MNGLFVLTFENNAHQRRYKRYFLPKKQNKMNKRLTL